MTTEPEIDEIKEKLVNFFSPEGCFVFIFGSRTDGTAKVNSDWDIGIISNKEIRGATMEKARDALEDIRTLHTFELVNFAHVSDEFRKIAMKKIIPLIGNR